MKRRASRSSASGSIGATLAVCLFLGAAPAPAVAARLVFTETEPLRTTCASLRNGMKVGIRNETATRQSVSLTPVEFTDSAGAAVHGKAICGGLIVKVAPVVAGGRGTFAHIHSEGSAAQGELTGRLLLSTMRGKVSRREMQIGAADPKPGLEAAPLVVSQSVHLGDSSQGPIRIPVEGTVGRLPGRKENKKEEPTPTLGAVAGSNGSAAVAYAGAEPLSDATSKVKLELEPDGLDPGAYKGVIDLNQSDPEAGQVELEIKVASSWTIAALLLLAGILLALLLQRLLGRQQSLNRLQGRIGDLDERQKRAREKLQHEADATPGATWGSFRIGNLASCEAKLKVQLEDAADKAVIQFDKKVQESLEAAIAVVESQIDLLEAIPSHARALEKELHDAGVPARPSSEATAPDRYALLEICRTALRGRSVEAEKLTPLIEEIDVRAKQVHTLQGLQDRLGNLRHERPKLDLLVGQKGTELKQLDKQLAVSQYFLNTAVSAEDLDTAAKAIQTAAILFAGLWYELPDAIPGEALRYALVDDRRLSEFVDEDSERPPPSDEAAAISALEVPADAPSAQPPTPSLPEAPPNPELGPGAVRRKARRGHAIQWGAIMIGGLVALASGLIALYVPNETWGSDWDYLAAAIWGLGAQASVTSLATAIDGLGAFGLLRQV